MPQALPDAAPGAGSSCACGQAGGRHSRRGKTSAEWPALSGEPAFDDASLSTFITRPRLQFKISYKCITNGCVMAGQDEPPAASPEAVEPGTRDHPRRQHKRNKRRAPPDADADSSEGELGGPDVHSLSYHTTQQRRCGLAALRLDGNGCMLEAGAPEFAAGGFHDKA